MAGIPTTISDDFETQQDINNPPKIGVWTPIGSQRSFEDAQGGGGGTTGVIENGVLFFEGVGISLSYEAPAGTVYDISGITEITLQDISTTVDTEINLTIAYDRGDLFFPITVTRVIGPDANFVTFRLEEFIAQGLDPTNVTAIVFLIGSVTTEEFTFTLGAILSDGIPPPPICVARYTKILMADGTYKSVARLERGDEVAGDFNGKVHKVARVIRSKISAITPVHVVKLRKDTLGPNNPNANTIITSNHPIFYNGERYTAKCFRKMRGAKYMGCAAGKVLPLNSDGQSCTLFNLQFETDGYYIANGLIVDSVPTKSTLMPLPEDMYFNKELIGQKSETVIPKLHKRCVLLRHKKEVEV